MSLWSTVKGILRDWGLVQPDVAPPTNATQAMAELRAQKAKPASSTDWDGLVRRFNTLVFSEGDRVRVWRRHRTRFAGALHEWEEITAPTNEDLACLRQIVEDLSR